MKARYIKTSGKSGETGESAESGGQTWDGHGAPSQKPETMAQKYRAVLEGAGYERIDEMKNLTVEECRVIGMEAKVITLNIIKERDVLYKKLIDLMRSKNGLQCGKF